MGDDAARGEVIATSKKKGGSPFFLGGKGEKERCRLKKTSSQQCFFVTKGQRKGRPKKKKKCEDLPGLLGGRKKKRNRYGG